MSLFLLNKKKYNKQEGILNLVENIYIKQTCMTTSQEIKRQYRK